ncbi:hypothetical protein D4R75_09975 [bacterium]|nr:MAG: hypothetical protein D4R75_09975 [bacterium]
MDKMRRSKKEMTELLNKSLSEDPSFVRAFDAFKMYYGIAKEHKGAIVAAVGCFFLLWINARKHTFVLLAAQGWFPELDLTLGVSDEMNRLILDGKSAEVDQLLTKVYTKKLTDIEHKIAASYPDRMEIIRQAFSAHRKKQYCLSVPVFLVQADGIARHLTGGEFFRKARRRPLTAKFVETTIHNPIYAPLFEILRSNLPISASEHERQYAAIDLNRHAILHGQDTNYGSETNSLKAVSLLSYLSSLGSMLEQANQPMEVIDQLLSIVPVNQSIAPASKTGRA